MAFSLIDLARLVHGKIVGDQTLQIDSVATLINAQPNQIAFLTNRKYVEQARATLAGAIIISHADWQALQTPHLDQSEQAALTEAAHLDSETNRSQRSFLIADNPHVAYALIVQHMLSNRSINYQPGVDPRAVIGENVAIAASAHIAPFVVIENGATIGERVVISSHSHIGSNVVIDDDCYFYPRVSIYHDCQIGKRVILHSGVVIGADGFGFAPDFVKSKSAVEAENKVDDSTDQRVINGSKSKNQHVVDHLSESFTTERKPAGEWVKVPQIGAVIMGNDVEIGANSTIDRGALGDTIIGDDVKIDNLVQIAHNCKIGAHTVIAACVGIAGSTVIGQYCMLGGAVGVAGHVVLGDNVIVTAKSGVSKSLLKPGMYTSAFPAIPHAEWNRNAAIMRNLDKLRARIQQLERRLKEKAE